MAAITMAIINNATGGGGAENFDATEVMPTCLLLENV
jgi:hypothetical protein